MNKHFYKIGNNIFIYYSIPQDTGVTSHTHTHTLISLREIAIVLYYFIDLIIYFDVGVRLEFLQFFANMAVLEVLFQLFKCLVHLCVAIARLFVVGSDSSILKEVCTAWEIPVRSKLKRFPFRI